MEDDGVVVSRAVLVQELRAAGCVFAEDEADVLLGLDLTADRLADLARRRITGEPLEYLVGTADFGGRQIVIEPGVFVPRRRTELLAELAIARLQDGGDQVLVDLCCGSGAVAAVVMAAVDTVQVYTTDCDPVAVRCADRNLPNATVLLGDLYRPLPATLRGQVTVIVANAPYVPRSALALLPPEARLYEPPAALDGGPDGLDVLRRVIAGAPDWLAPTGVLLVESGADQLRPLAEHAGEHGLIATVHTDEDRGATVLELCRRLGC